MNRPKDEAAPPALRVAKPSDVPLVRKEVERLARPLTLLALAYLMSNPDQALYSTRQFGGWRLRRVERVEPKEERL